MISLPFARGVMELCGAGAGFSLAPFCAVSSLTGVDLEPADV
jgi:hypothetical protein